MRDEVHRVVAGHVLFLQEVGGVRFAFGEDRDKHVRARHLGPARRLHMDRGALDHALEGGGRHGFGPFDIGHKGRQIIVDEVDQRLLEGIEIDRAGAHDLGGVGFVDQRQKQMLQRGKFMFARIRERECSVDRLFQRGRK